MLRLVLLDGKFIKLPYIFSTFNPNRILVNGPQMTIVMQIPNRRVGDIFYSQRLDLI